MPSEEEATVLTAWKARGRELERRNRTLLAAATSTNDAGRALHTADNDLAAMIRESPA